MKKIVKNQGITLIALVITIIVLLILAGVSLNLVSGSNGILGRATNAVNKTNEAKVAEEVELAMAQLQMEYYQARYVDGTTSESFADYAKAKLESTSGVATTNGTLTLNGNEISYASTDEKTTATGTFNATTGAVTIAGTTTDAPTTPAEPQLSEVETLLGYKGNTNSNDLQVGDHINYYYYADVEPIECVVLYNDATYGIQVVSTHAVGSNVYLGSGDYEGALESYNSAVSTLNLAAMAYVTDGGMATGGRCVGSNPLPEHENDAENNAMVTAADDPYGLEWAREEGFVWDVSFKLGDEYYSEDYNTMKNMTTPIHNIGEEYWLASRFVDSSDPNHLEFNVRAVDQDGNKSHGNLCMVGAVGGGSGTPFELALRPCFYLKSNIPVEKVN